MLLEPIDFPRKLAPLFGPKRYKVLRGGRGGTKSWGVGRALLLRGVQGKLQCICAREFQSSIRDSVHKLLRSQIASLGLSSCYRVEQSAIYGPHGTQFVFVGLSDQTAENLKSYEDFDVCWVEEAQVLTERSLQILTPTIRKPGSEIWFTYNPQLENDPIEEFARSLTDADGIVIDLNWRDNPWFTDELEAERQRAKRTMSKIDYENIWEGKLRPAASGAIYAEEMAQLYEEKRVGEFPYDPFHLVHPVFDLGWNDKMSIGLAQRHISQIRVIEYLENDHKTLDWYSRELRNKPYAYGKVYLPHDGESGDYRTGKSAKDILEGLGWQVECLPRSNVEEGIRVARMAFKQLYVNESKCARLLECLKRYKRAVPKSTNEPQGPLHDEFSHGADMWRYTAIAAPLMDDDRAPNLAPLSYPKSTVV